VKLWGRILRDDEIELTVFRTDAKYPQRLRRVEAEVQIDGVWHLPQYAELMTGWRGCFWFFHTRLSGR
jgi:hypothetical protein